MKIRHYYLRCSTRTALHIGSNTEGRNVSDSMFRRDAAGRLILPGTSIAGAIRGHLTRIIPAMSGLSEERTICGSLDGRDGSSAHILYHLMGDLKPDRTDDTHTSRSRASRLLVNDGVLETTQTHIRDGVGIDRISGAASRQGRVKFDAETVPAGTPLSVLLELEDYDDMDSYLMGLALYEWQAGRIRFGGDTGRGLGAIQIERVEQVDYDLDNPNELMAYLRREIINGHEITPLPAPARRSDLFGAHRRVIDPHFIDIPVDEQYPYDLSVQHWVEFRFELQAQGLFLTNDATRAAEKGFDHYSLSFLPGSSLRGTIRSHAERIARTLANLNATNQADFLASCPAADPFVTWWSPYDSGLEATASRILRSESDSVDKADPAPNLFDLSERLFGTTFYGSRLLVDDAALKSEAVWKKLDFVAIDRFTGGAANEMKFDAYALWQPRFSCRLYLEAPQTWEIGWLIQVLEDMADGVVPVGFGAAKGFGDVWLEDLQITLGYAHPEALVGLTLPQVGNTFFTEVRLDTPEVMEELVRQWRDAVNVFRVHPVVPHNFKADPYWGDDDILTLYPREGGVE